MIPQLDQLADTLEIFYKISGEDGLVMGYPIAESPDLFQIVVDRSADFDHSFRRVMLREHALQMNVPQANIVSMRKHFLPKHELQFRNDFPG